MKNILIGCAAFMLLGLVLVGGGFWYFVVQPVSGFVSELNQVTEVWREANGLEREVANTEAFVAPTSGDMTQEQVDSFVAIQRAISSASTVEGQQFRDQLQAWDAQMSGRDMSFMAAREQLSRMPEVLQQLGTTYLALKQVQVDALNTAGMSVGEYRWLRITFYRALGFELVPAEVGELAERARELASSGMKPDTNVELNLDRVKGGMNPTENRGSEANRALAAPFAEEAQTWFAHAPFL